MAAVLTEPEAAKAAVTAPDGGMLFYSFPIEKVSDAGDGCVEIAGRVTDGSLDSDLQIVDPAWSEKALKEWFDTGANIRVQHQHMRDPAGKGIHLDGHYLRARIVEPTAVKLVKAGVLRDFSIGVMNPDIVRPGERRYAEFKYLDPAGRAVNGIITGRADGLTKVGEVSTVDRGSNFGTRFAFCKAAADGSCLYVGELTAPDSVLARAEAPKVYKTVSVDLPRKARISVSPAVLAKMNTMARRNAVPDAPEVAEAAEAQKRHITEDEAREASIAAIRAAESGIYKRDIDTATRRRLASEGRALPNLSYPIENEGDLRNAATLAQSGHGDVPAARRLIAREARRLGVKNPLKKKLKAAKAAAPDAAKCACAGTGMAGEIPCTGCGKGREQAEALVARSLAGLDKAAVPDAAKKKPKVMCGHCGANQNSKHVHCPECGNALYPGAMPIAKNHDFTCLHCGHDPLDKGEPHCPGCGKENPGYLPEADHKIPSNKADAGKERVTEATAVTKAKGKKPKKGKKPFGGKKAMPFGKDKDDADGKPEPGEKKAARPVAAKGKNKKGKGGKGRSPAVGAVSQTTMGLPPHREPDGMPVEAFERTTRLEDGDEHPEMEASMRHKALNLDPKLAALHDLCCPAFRPGDVTKSHPWASFAGIDTEYWQAEALNAASTGDMATAMDAYNKAAEVSRCAVTLKTADPQLLHDIRLTNHQAFLKANKAALKAFRDATPGPGSFPTPSHPMPGQFRRPYEQAGHAAESPQAGPARSFPVTEGAPMATDFTRGYLTSGHATDSPANPTPRPMPQPQNMEAGSPAHMSVEHTLADNARHSVDVMHDTLSRRFPDVCPMSPPMGQTQKPAPGPAVAVGAPTPHAAPKAARPKKAKAAVTGRQPKAAKAGKAAGLTALPPPAPAPASAPQVPAPAVTDKDALALAVKAALAPVGKRLAKQGKALRKVAKVANAIADSRDTAAAPMRGAGVMKAASPALAGPVTMAGTAEQAQVAKYMRLQSTWRTTTIPEEQEACWQEMQAMLGTAPLTDTTSTGLMPVRRNPISPMT